MIEAAKNLVMMDLALLQAEAAAGMYKRPVEELAKEVRYDPPASRSADRRYRGVVGGGLLPKARWNG